MKKNKKNRQGKIIPFPKLEERLLDRGMELLEEKQYKDALQIFNQLISYHSHYPEVEIGIVVCLLELGLYEDAKEKCERLLQHDVGDYFKVLQIYITILIQLSEYDKVATMLEALFEEEKIPSEYAEELFHLLEFSRKRKDNQIEEGSFNIEDLEHQLLYGHTDQQIYAVQKLRDKSNLSPIIDSLRTILQNEHVNPIIQSMVIQLMIEKQINETFVIRKFQKTIKIVPGQLKNIFDESFTIEVLNKLDDILGQENPTLFESVKQLWERFLFAIFPFKPEPQQVMLWAAALHKFGYKLYGIEITNEEINRIYRVEKEDVKRIYHEIMEVEKLSIIGTNL